MDMAADGHVVGMEAQACNLGEETDIEVEVMRARLEQDGVAAIGEMRAFLLRKPGVDLALRTWHSWVDDQDMLAEVRFVQAPSALCRHRMRADRGHARQNRAACRSSRQPVVPFNAGSYRRRYLSDPRRHWPSLSILSPPRCFGWFPAPSRSKPSSERTEGKRSERDGVAR